MGTVRALKATKQTDNRRAEQIRIDGSRRRLTLTGFDFRALYGFERIRSLFFRVFPVSDGIVLDGHGWGHGVGMCQWGAAELARQGWRAADILGYYYPDIQLVSLRDVQGQPLNLLGGSS